MKGGSVIFCTSDKKVPSENFTYLGAGVDSVANVEATITASQAQDHPVKQIALS